MEEMQRLVPWTEIMVAPARREAAHKLLHNFASMHGLCEHEAASIVLQNLGDFGHQMGIVDPSVLEDVENYARWVLIHQRHQMYVQEQDALAFPAPFVWPVDSRGQTEIIHGAAGVRSSILHRDLENRATLQVGSRRCVLQDLGASDSTARGYHWSRISSVGADNGDSSRILNWSAAANPNAGTGSGGSAGDHIFIDMRAFLIENSDLVGEELRETESENSLPRRILETAIGTLLPAAVVNARDFFSDTPDIVKLAGDDNGRNLHLMPARGFSQNISPRAHEMILGDGGWNYVNPTLVGNDDDDTSIDMRALFLKFSEETDSETARVRRILETAIGTLLPAAVVNARDFFSDTPEIVKLAGNMILPALLAFCLIGMLHKRKAGSILRLATCAAIAAATLGVSSQLSDRIYAFIAVVAGVALSFTTLTA